jgi:hypothetical protein
MLIRQRYDIDCVIATIAMYTHKTYEDVIEVCERLKIRPLGLCGYDSIRILKEFGHELVQCFDFYDFVPCIVSVPSLNSRGKMHSVYWDGQRVWDPQEGNEGKEFYDNELLFGGFASVLVDMKLVHAPIEESPTV